MQVACGVPKSASCLQIADFSRRASSVCTPHVGLWLDRLWAEYLTVTATSLLIPVELYELERTLRGISAVSQAAEIR
jgi:hypothetical protein